MKLNTRYAFYLSGALLSGALLMLLMVGILLLKDGDQFRNRLQKDLKYHLILDQQESLVTTADYLGRRLFNPLHQLDINTLNREIEDIRAWLPVRRFEIVDKHGIILTDGSRENPQYGQHIEDERIGHFDLIYPHVYSFPGEVGIPGGIGLTFSISRDTKLAGYARVILSENAFNTSVDRVASLLGSMWSSALDMLYTLGLVAALSALLMAAAFSWLFSRRLSAPLTEMSLAARKFANGQLDYVIPLNSQDEIGELAGSLNTMAHQLWKSGRLLGKAQEMTGVGGWEFDALLDHFEWSPQVSHIFRVRQDMLPSTRSSLAALVDADERSALLDIFVADYSQNPNFGLEFRLLRRDGEQRTLQVLGEVTLGEDGRL